MDTYEKVDIEYLIEKDIQRIQHIGNRNSREKSLRKYYSDPNYCKCCGKMILVQEGERAFIAKGKQFCDCKCAALYNNSVRVNVKTGPKPILDSYSDDDFIKAYNNCTSYRQLISELGYQVANSRLTNMLKNRIGLLGLEDYDEKKQTVASSTKGELIARSRNWQSWRGQIQKNAREVYLNSNKPKKCIICEYDKTYEVAHIHAVSEYDNNAYVYEINDINNLVALCPNHHWEYDHGYLKLDDYIMVT